MTQEIYTIAQLETLSGISRRTIRFYITRELLDPPEGSKRGSFYTLKHFEDLKKIKQYVSEGYPLIQIKPLLEANKNINVKDKKLSSKSSHKPETTKPTSSTINREVMERYHLVPGIELHTTPGRIDTETLIKIQKLIQTSQKSLIKEKNE
jgi:DNA-binding transcriptional MerR regulator